MFDYFNIRLFIILLVLSPVILYKRDLLISILFGFIFVLLLLEAYSCYSDAKKSMKYFQDGNTLICLSGGGLYSSASRYSTSKQEGWQLQKNYFKKDSLLIGAKYTK